MWSQHNLFLHCDGQVARKVLSDNPDGRAPISMVDLVSPEDFETVMKTNKEVQKTFYMFCEIYDNTLNSGVRIEPDEFGGFGLMYRGPAVLRSMKVLPFPVGILCRVPPAIMGTINQISVMNGDVYKDVLMIGTARWANSSCGPNAEYYEGGGYFGHRCVRLRVLPGNEIRPGQWITTFYGDNFFDLNNEACLCPYTDRHLKVVADPTHVESDGQLQSDETAITTPKPRRYKMKTLEEARYNANKLQFQRGDAMDIEYGRQVTADTGLDGDPVAVFNISVDQPDPASASDINADQLDAAHDSVVNADQLDAAHESASDHASDPASDSDTDINVDQHDPAFDQPGPIVEGDQPQRSSTPVEEDTLDLELLFLNAHDVTNPVSEISAIDHATSLIQINDEDDVLGLSTERLYSGAGNVTVRNSVVSLLAIVSKHCGSDELLYELIARERLILPYKSRCPAPHAIKARLKNAVGQHIKSITNINGQDRISLYFKRDLLAIIKKNLAHIQSYASVREATRDMPIPLFNSSSPHTFSVYIIINTDGAQIINSKNFSVWPLWLAIGNLPPILRYSFCNITLASLWCGRKPNWDLVFEDLKDELNRDVPSICVNGVPMNLTFTPIFLVADLIAKASILNMKQYNGFYGCNLCDERGIHKDNSHQYPHTNALVMRTPLSYAKSLSSTLAGSKKERANKEDPEKYTKGVIGLAKIFEIISQLPLTCTIDYMHQVLLGVVKHLLNKIYEKLLSLVQKQELNALVMSIKSPTEIKRRVRGLNQLALFKASELKTWLLYVGPVFLKYFLLNDDASMYDDYLLLSHAIFLLLESSDVNDTTIADDMLNSFCTSITARHPKWKTQSYNYHSLRHLGWQVSNFGPLWTTSAMAFESANHRLCAPFTGTVNHGTILVERYLRSRIIKNTTICEDNLQQITNKLIDPSRVFVDDLCMISSDYMNLFRLENPGVRLYCRERSGYLRLDSMAYSRSSSNSYVGFCDNNGCLEMGRILFFYQANTGKMCVVEIFTETGNIVCSADIPARIHNVSLSSVKKDIALGDITCKYFYMSVFDDIYLCRLGAHFDHD